MKYLEIALPSRRFEIHAWHAIFWNTTQCTDRTNSGLVGFAPKCRWWSGSGLKMASTRGRGGATAKDNCHYISSPIHRPPYWGRLILRYISVFDSWAIIDEPGQTIGLMGTDAFQHIRIPLRVSYAICSTSESNGISIGGSACPKRVLDRSCDLGSTDSWKTMSVTHMHI